MSFPYHYNEGKAKKVHFPVFFIVICNFFAILFNTLFIIKKLKTIMKKERHERAEAFRRQIVLPVQRNIVIKEFLRKEAFDDSDKQRIRLLFQKAAYLENCEEGYRQLIEKINNQNDEKLKQVALPFSIKVGMK